MWMNVLFVSGNLVRFGWCLLYGVVCVGWLGWGCCWIIFLVIKEMFLDMFENEVFLVLLVGMVDMG